MTTLSKIAKNIIIFGAPGGGKGTICNKLVKDFQFTHISTGNLLRNQVAKNTALGTQVKSFLAEGLLVPDQIVVDIIKSEINQKDSHLFDGFPRTIEQASILIQALKIDAVISLEIPFEVIIERLSNRWIHIPSGRTYAYDYNPPIKHGLDDITGEALIQREDDNPISIKRRLEEYEKVTSPVLNFFSQQQNIKFSNFKGSESNVIYKNLKPFLVEHVLNI